MQFRAPMSDPSSLGLTWWTEVRTWSLSRKKMPITSALSYPIPGEGKLFLFHTFPFTRADANGWQVISRITARIPDLEVVEFLTPGDGDLFPGLPAEVVGEPAAYDLKIEEALLQVLPLVSGRYAEGAAAGALGTQFLESLEMLAPKALMPYYEALNSGFFAWCRGQ